MPTAVKNSDLYRLDPSLRRSVVYLLASLPVLAGVGYWVEHFVQRRAPADNAAGFIVVGLFAFLLFLPLRWTLRVDRRGVSRRLLRWETWPWSDFEEGAVEKRHPFVLVNRRRGWWRRKLNLGYLTDADREQLLRRINEHYRLPPAPPIPESLEIRHGWRRKISFDWRGAHLVERGAPREYLWDEVRRVRFVRLDRLRRDFKALDIVLPDRVIELQVFVTQGGPTPSWRGATAEELNEFLHRHVPAERIVVELAGERPAHAADIERQLQELRQSLRVLRGMMWIFGAATVAMLIWTVLTEGAAQTLRIVVMLVGVTATVAPVIRLLTKGGRQKIAQLEGWLEGRGAEEEMISSNDE